MVTTLSSTIVSILIFSMQKFVLCENEALENVFLNQCEKEICTPISNGYKPKKLKLGVEVIGVDLVEKLKQSDFIESLNSDVHIHRLLVFRNQTNLSPESLVEVAKLFGDVYSEVYPTWRNEYRSHIKSPLPSITRVSNDKSEGFTGGGTSGWHIDGAFDEKPHSVILFHAVEAPKKGDTRYVGFREIVKFLSDQTLQKLDRLYTKHIRIFNDVQIPILHPVLYNHPKTGEKVLCIHLGYMNEIMEKDGNETRMLNVEEVKTMKREINHAIISNEEEIVYSHKWEKGDLVVWDNLAVAHEASKESQFAVKDVGLRVLHWVSVLGKTKPVKSMNTDCV